jgi:hypothetical protein
MTVPDEALALNFQLQATANTFATTGRLRFVIEH